MLSRNRFLAHSLLLFPATWLTFSGCTIPQHNAARDPKRTESFISYRPPAPGNPGLRLAVKDLIDMEGEVTSAGSEFLSKNAAPARKDAACLRIARERGVQIVGKTNLTELAVGVSGINIYFGTPRNPLNPRRRLIPGGSSSGSAVAVATDLADVAFGTDTAGSIRVPAACCGVAGLKTTFGLIPLDGVYPIAPNQLDTVGPMARDVEGLVKGMDLLQGGFAARYQSRAKPAARQITVGRLYLNGTDPRIDQAVDAALARAGFRVVKFGENFRAKWEQAQRDGQTVATANAWVYDQKYQKENGVTLRTKAVVLLGEREFKVNLPGALRRRKAWQAEMRRRFQQVDFIALPTLQTLPPAVPPFGGTPLFEAVALASQNTVAVNLGGNPALALPVPVDDTVVPLTSVQLIGPMRSEAALLHAGRLIEKSAPATRLAQQ